MAVIGLLLLLSAAGLSLDLVFQNASSINVDAFGQTLTLSPGWLFVAGVATGALGLFGLKMVFGGVGRTRRRRLALAQSRGMSQDLQAERDRLAAELDRERAARTTAEPGALRHSPATVDLAGAERRSSSASAEDASVADADTREAVVAGRHGIFHRRDH